MTSRAAVSRMLQVGSAQLTRKQTPPRCVRKQTVIGYADVEVIGWRTRRSLDEGDRLPHIAWMDGARWRMALLDLTPGDAPDERPVADAPDHHAIGDQLLVRDADCVSRHRQAARQLPRRGKPFSRLQAAIQNRFEQLPVNLRRQVAAPPEPDVDVHGITMIGPVQEVNIGSLIRPNPCLQ